MIDIRKKINRYTYRVAQVVAVIGLVLILGTTYTLWLYNSGWLCAL